jgi:hypothetical protein
MTSCPPPHYHPVQCALALNQCMTRSDPDRQGQCSNTPLRSRLDGHHTGILDGRTKAFRPATNPPHQPYPRDKVHSAGNRGASNQSAAQMPHASTNDQKTGGQNTTGMAEPVFQRTCLPLAPSSPRGRAPRSDQALREPALDGRGEGFKTAADGRPTSRLLLSRVGDGTVHVRWYVMWRYRR